MLVALCKIHTFAKKWAPQINRIHHSQSEPPYYLYVDCGYRDREKGNASQKEKGKTKEDCSPRKTFEEENREWLHKAEACGEQQEVQHVQAVREAVQGVPGAGGPHAPGPQRT